jgi:HK97 gp10 family phage protein
MVVITYTVKPRLKAFAQVFGKMDFKSFLREETREMAFNTERFGKQLTPVDTGRLRGSIGVSSLVGAIGHMVSTNTEYASYVHGGTRYMRARPFLTKGLAYAKQNLKGKIGSKLDKKIADKFKKL